MKKKYEVSGMMEWHPVFMAGKTRIQVSFRGGNLCGGASTAASYETSDPVVQAVIEHSEAFRSGRIKIVRTWGENSRKSHVLTGINRNAGNCNGQKSNDNCHIAASTPGKSEKTVRVEYENIGEVTDLLHYDNGVPLDRLFDEESCRKEAAILGIELVKKG